MAFSLTSTAFADGERIPQECTCDGGEMSPELNWQGAPQQSRSFALIMHDPDAPKGDFTHWLLWDIPATATTLSSGAGGASAGTAGTNSFNKIGYGGPCPPMDDAPHHYHFDLYALDIERLELPASAQRAEVESALQNHIIAQTRLTGSYGKK